MTTPLLVSLALSAALLASAGCRVQTPPVPSRPVVLTSQNGLTAPQVLARMQQRYRTIGDLRVRFEQESYSALTGTSSAQHGALWLLHPGRFRWEFSLPPGDFVLCDGATLWTYDRAARRAHRAPIAHGGTHSLLATLLGPVDLSGTFSSQLLAPGEQSRTTDYVLELFPRAPYPGVSRLLLFVEPALYRLVRVVLFDAEGGRSSLTFGEPQLDTHLDPALFVWTPPEGVVVGTEP